MIYFSCDWLFYDILSRIQSCETAYETLRKYAEMNAQISKQIAETPLENGQLESAAVFFIFYLLDYTITYLKPYEKRERNVLWALF